MKLCGTIAITVTLIYCACSHASGLAQGKRFEISGYFSAVSYGENISAQTDISAGANIFSYMNVSATMNAGYRNYSFVTTGYLSVSAGAPLGPHEFRLGAMCGIYTLRLSGYHAAIPCAGGEGLYAYCVAPGLSVRIKERVCGFFDNRHTLVSTSTHVGFCFAFGNR